MRALLLVLIQCAALGPLWAQKPKLYVFLPSTIRPYAMERTLQTACPQLEIRVFGRHREFLRGVEADQPDGVLSLEPVILKSEFKPYQKVFSGIKGGQHQVPYALLSVDRELQAKSLDGVSIGVVDLLGRQQMKSFLSKMLSGAEPKINRSPNSKTFYPCSRFGKPMPFLSPKPCGTAITERGQKWTLFSIRWKMPKSD